MVERKTDWEIIVLACIGTVLVMSGIYFIGLQLNDYKVGALENDVAELEVDHRSQSLGLQVAETIDDDNCNAIREWRESSMPELRDLRLKVESYEDSNRIENGEYEIVKKRYTNLVIQGIIESRMLEEQCRESTGEIIYIYSQSCAMCDDQGTILTYYRRNYSGNLAVYPLDADLNMRPVNFLQDYYEIEEYPAVIVEGEVYQGFQDQEEMGQILKENVDGIDI